MQDQGNGSTTENTHLPIISPEASTNVSTEREDELTTQKSQIPAEISGTEDAKDGQQTTCDEESVKQEVTTAKLYIVMAALCFATFLYAINASIVATVSSSSWYGFLPKSSN